jgi:hypothetical protein
LQGVINVDLLPPLPSAFGNDDSGPDRPLSEYMDSLLSG